MGAFEADARILIVDDEPDLTDLLSDILSEAGYRKVASVNDGKSFTRRFIEFAPDLVLLDLNMPGIGGMEILEWIRQLVGEHAYLPVVVLTGDHDRETRRRVLASGAHDFLTKPPDMTETLLRIGNLLQTRFLHRRVRMQNTELEMTVTQRTEQLRRALEDLAQANEELRSSHEETVRRFAAAAEFRDGETARHLQRIGGYSAQLAAAIGLDAADCELIKLAAPMHDIGKMCVPDRVLMKKTLLSPAEFEVMKTHAEIGKSILEGSTSSLLQSAAMIAWTHHERWDGSGYPRGLVGEAIPLEGRIVAVADAYDSMTSMRRYKDAIPAERAIELLRSDSGAHFEPCLVEVFIDGVDRMSAIDLR